MVTSAHEPNVMTDFLRSRRRLFSDRHLKLNRVRPERVCKAKPTNAAGKPAVADERHAGSSGGHSEPKRYKIPQPGFAVTDAAVARINCNHPPRGLSLKQQSKMTKEDRVLAQFWHS
jgi:hypothetical protein